MIVFFIHQKLNEKVKEPVNKNLTDEIIYNSNIINNVNYTTKDANGNEYIITALKGEIDLNDPNILYLNL